MNGFLILAYGRDYAKMASNLANSLLLYGQNVTIITDQGREFDQRINVIFETSKYPFLEKTRLYAKSPYQHTIYLDADSLCIADPSGLFDEPGDFDIHVVNSWQYTDAHKCPMLWADLGQLWNYYAFNRAATYQETNSSYIRWRSGETAKRLFALANYLYESYPFKDYNYKVFTTYPDELAFSSAMVFREIECPKSSPLFIRYGTGTMDRPEASGKYFITMPGHRNTHPHLWKFYNNYGFSNIPNFERISRDQKVTGQPGREPWRGLSEFDYIRFKELAHE